MNVTRGELSASGDLVQRIRESQFISKLRKSISIRCLELNDGFISSADYSQLSRFISIIRQIKPSIILAPYFTDDHPDHGEVHKLVNSAKYKAATAIYPELGRPYNCKFVFYYAQDIVLNGHSILIDVSKVYDEKQEVLKSYKSQLFNFEGRPTYTNKYLYDKICKKDAYLGCLAQVDFAEELISPKNLIFNNLFGIIR